ncbi:DUF2933 domain-containing protein [Paenibacillus cisolokensis]|jgi:hypothetical protein|uniref:DUF2933 domain-containing protein n=1 Tax=Paenibacillus thermoaerophilus TaxID=1215385 RepID=A0ABW2V687_9BACL|nr:DUF2933 domain-containing protein [Paenibacillus thermoaerophilus]TMV05738.1 DUF2933 domain-containing protein [Paenibacillus thermoaerophilus]
MDWTWLLLLLCPLMMIFMMKGMHGTHGKHEHQTEKEILELKKENQRLSQELEHLRKNTG